MGLAYELSFILKNYHKSRGYCPILEISRPNYPEEKRTVTEDGNVNLNEIQFLKRYPIELTFETYNEVVIILKKKSQKNQLEKLEEYKVKLMDILRERNGKEIIKPKGTIIIKAETITNVNEKIVKFNVELKFKLSNCLELAIHRSGESGTVLVDKKNVSGIDKKISIEIDKNVLCQNDNQRKITVALIKITKNNYKSLHAMSFTIQEFLTKSILKSESIKTKMGRSEKCQMNLTNLIEQDCYTITEFMESGLKISCAIAIDFTISNKQPLNSESLHHHLPNRPSKYAIAIEKLITVLNQYDDDNLYPVYGFGAFPNSNSSQVSHCFPLYDDILCNGINGVLEAYEKAIKTIVMGCPTYLAPIIETYKTFIDSTTGKRRYFILVILTDGDFDDVDKTKQAIMNAINLPLSIVIIGIGGTIDTDFKILKELDNSLELNGKPAERDIVKFVDFQPFEVLLKNSKIKEFDLTFCKTVLEEIPGQVKDYMAMNNINPSLLRSLTFNNIG